MVKLAVGNQNQPTAEKPVGKNLQSSGLLNFFFPKIFCQDFATIRAIDYFLVHAFHLLPIFASGASPKKKKKGKEKKHGRLHPKRCDKCLSHQVLL